MSQTIQDRYEALNLAIHILFEHGMDDEALRVMEKCNHNYLLRYQRDKEGVLALLRAKVQVGSVVVRVVEPGVELPRFDSRSRPQWPDEDYAADLDWSGLLMVLRPGAYRAYCVRDIEKYSKEECEAAFFRVGWSSLNPKGEMVGGGLAVLDLAPERIMDWDTLTPRLSGVEVAYPCVTDMEVAHLNWQAAVNG